MSAEMTESERVVRKYGILDGQAKEWIEHWKALGVLFLPRRGDFLSSRKQPRFGGIKNLEIVNEAGMLAAQILQSGMLGGFTSPTRPWFKISHASPDLRAQHDVKLWLDTVQRRMYDTIARSGFYKVQSNGVYKELGVFGGSVVLEERDYDRVARFEQFTIGSYLLAQGPDGKTNTLYRKRKMTSEQMVSMFGLTHVSQKVKDNYERGMGQDWFDVIHAIEPNPTHNPNALNANRLKVRSAWIEPHSDDKPFLRVSGYNSFPAFTPFWERSGDSQYGNSCPGMIAYGSNRSLQAKERSYNKALDRLIDPPLKAAKSLRTSTVDLTRNGVTYVDDPKDGLSPIHQGMNPPLRDLDASIGRVEERIGRAFFTDLFLMISQSDRRQITATEIASRNEEKMLQLGPVLESLIDDFLDPMIDRTFELMLAAGQIPEPPDALRDQDLKIEYVSVLAQAQRAIGVTSMDRYVDSVRQVGEWAPEAFDKVAVDDVVDEYADMLGVPPTVVRPSDAVADIREARQRRQDEERQVAMDAEQAKQVQALGNTPSAQQGQTALSDLVGSDLAAGGLV